LYKKSPVHAAVDGINVAATEAMDLAVPFRLIMKNNNLLGFLANQNFILKRKIIFIDVLRSLRLSIITINFHFTVYQ
jgi:hypothetical protein